MKTMIVKHLLMATFISVLLAACATSTMKEGERTLAYEQFIETNKLKSIKSITSFNFYSWTALGDQHLIISSRFNRPYLIKLQRSCFDLSFANTIVIHQNGSSLHARFDAISVMEPISVKCFIQSIYPLNKAQVKAITQIGHEDDKPNEEHLLDKDSKQE